MPLAGDTSSKLSSVLCRISCQATRTSVNQSERVWEGAYSAQVVLDLMMTGLLYPEVERHMRMSRPSLWVALLLCRDRCSLDRWP